jgi:hypothetical protein
VARSVGFRVLAQPESAAFWMEPNQLVVVWVGLFSTIGPAPALSASPVSFGAPVEVLGNVETVAGPALS